MNLTVLPPMLAIAVLSLFLPPRRFRPALAGAVFTALGLASLQVAGGPDWRGAGLPRTYLSVTAALLLIGLLLPLALAGIAIRSGELPGGRRAGAVAAAVLLLVAAGRVAIPLALAGGPARTALAAAMLASVGILSGGLARPLSLGDRLRRLDRAVFGSIEGEPGRPWGPTERWLFGAHAALAAVALVSPHLILLLGAILGTAITGVLLDRRLGLSTRWPWSVIGGLVLLALSSAFLIQVAGEVPLSLSELRDGPFSPAFELGASLGFIGAALPLLQLWPFHARARGPATPLAGAALLVLLVTPILPEGTRHWQPVVFPLLVVGGWYAAGAGSLQLALMALATAGLICLRPAAAWAGVVLLVLLALLGLRKRLVLPEPLGRMMVAGATVVGAGLAPTILAGALQAQTVYTVLLAAALAATLLGRG
jgi:hypothetical protein